MIRLKQLKARLRAFFTRRPRLPEAPIQDYLDVLNGEGRHAGHVREQMGDKVVCSCGTVAMGRMG